MLRTGIAARPSAPEEREQQKPSAGPTRATRPTRATPKKKRAPPKDDAGTDTKTSPATSTVNKKAREQEEDDEEEHEKSVRDLTGEDDNPAEPPVYFPVQPMPAQCMFPLYEKPCCSHTKPELRCAVPEYGVARGRIFGST